MKKEFTRAAQLLLWGVCSSMIAQIALADDSPCRGAATTAAREQVLQNEQKTIRAGGGVTFLNARASETVTDREFEVRVEIRLRKGDPSISFWKVETKLHGVLCSAENPQQVK